MNPLTAPLSALDPEVHAALRAESARQRSTLEMIASENLAPAAVMEAQGSVPTDKYAEGHPGRRYYGGGEHVDVTERLAVDRVKALFGAAHANVQPHPGAQANTAVPFDPRPPMVISGPRIGTPAPATRGFTEEDFAEAADAVALALRPGPDLPALRARTEALAAAHPLDPHLPLDGDVAR